MGWNHEGGPSWSWFSLLAGGDICLVALAVLFSLLTLPFLGAIFMILLWYVILVSPFSAYVFFRWIPKYQRQKQGEQGSTADSSGNETGEEEIDVNVKVKQDDSSVGAPLRGG